MGFVHQRVDLRSENGGISSERVITEKYRKKKKRNCEHFFVFFFFLFVLLVLLPIINIFLSYNFFFM